MDPPEGAEVLMDVYGKESLDWFHPDIVRFSRIIPEGLNAKEEYLSIPIMYQSVYVTLSENPMNALKETMFFTSEVFLLFVLAVCHTHFF